MHNVVCTSTTSLNEDRGQTLSNTRLGCQKLNVSSIQAGTAFNIPILILLHIAIACHQKPHNKGSTGLGKIGLGIVTMYLTATRYSGFKAPFKVRSFGIRMTYLTAKYRVLLRETLHLNAYSLV